ncbi:MAG: tetratricopeptide repeat protein, partial [Nitrospirae bacterium]|nr:tetratricopeptide repeat protein [Nitrospirota bacterium]
TVDHNSPALHPTRYTLPATRLTAFGIFWFFITLSVESSVIPIEDIIFEHRVYLPSIGLRIAFVSAVFYLVFRFSSFILQPSSFPSRHALRITVFLLAASVVVLSIAAYQRNAVWKDEMSLWTDVLKKAPKKARALNSFGFAVLSKGNSKDAVNFFEQAIKINPDYSDAYNNLGVSLINLGEYEKAISYITQAIITQATKIYPLYAHAHNNLAVALMAIGKAETAFSHAAYAIKIKPGYGDAYNTMGELYFQKEQYNDALNYFNKAIELNNSVASRYYNAALALEKLNRINDACSYWTKYTIIGEKEPDLQNVYEHMKNIKCQ